MIEIPNIDLTKNLDPPKDFEKLLQSCHVDLSEEFPKPEILLSIGKHEYKGNYYPTSVMTAGEFSAIVAQSTVQPPTKEWATTENLKNAKSKGFTIEDVKKKYKVRPEQETEFSNL